MARVKPLNQAVCTRCGGKNTERFGYSKKKGGSVWVCSDCEKPFLVATIVLHKPQEVESPA